MSAQHISSRTVPIKDAGHSDSYTCVRMTSALLSIAFAYWHSRLNLFSVTKKKQITILCRFTLSGTHRSPSLTTAHHRSPFSAHRRLALWFAFSVTCESAGSHSAACDAVMLFENCLHLQGQAVYWPRSEGNAVLRNVGSYSPKEAVASVHPRITCIGPCIAVYVKGFAGVT